MRDSNSNTRSQSKFRKSLLVILVYAILAPSANAALTQSDVTPPGGFITSLSGIGNGTNPDPGFDPATQFIFGAPSINESAFAGGATASNSSSFSDTFNINSSQGTARLGKVTFSGTAEQTYINTNVGKSNTMVHGGWVDTITINSPGMEGTQAIWLFQVDVFGDFNASGWVGAPRIEVEPYVNQLRLSPTTPGYDDGGSDPVVTSVQHGEWGGFAIPFPGGASTRTVNETPTFAAEITIGTPFELGIFTFGRAAADTNSAFPSIISDADFNGSVTWAGDAGLNTLGGGPIGTYSLASLSGTPWLLPIPLPAAVWMLAPALAGMFGFSRRTVC